MEKQRICEFLIFLIYVQVQFGGITANPYVKQRDEDFMLNSNCSESSPLPVGDFLIEGDTDYIDHDGLSNGPDEEQNILYNFEVVEDDNQTLPLEEESRDISNARIINGKMTSIEKFPWHVSLQRDNKHICSGAIVAPTIIITAAHCLKKSDSVSMYKVRVGSSFNNRGGSLVDVRQLMPNENYVTQFLDNDVALVQLAKRLQFSRTVQPLLVATRFDAVPVGRQLFVSGWGDSLKSGTNPFSSRLRYEDLRLMDFKACQKNYRPIANISSRVFCAGVASGARDSCQADTGGPVVSYVYGKPKLFGIVPWSAGCPVKGYPGVYTKISAMRPWLNQHITQLRNPRK